MSDSVEYAIFEAVATLEKERSKLSETIAGHKGEIDKHLDTIDIIRDWCEATERSLERTEASLVSLRKFLTRKEEAKSQRASALKRFVDKNADRLPPKVLNSYLNG